MSATTLVCLMYGISLASKGVVPWTVGIGMAAVGAAAGVIYYLHARVTEHPLVDLSLMRYPTFGVSVTAASLFRIGIGALPFLLPLMLQEGFGMSAAQSGLITFASSAGALVMKPGAEYALDGSVSAGR